MGNLAFNPVSVLTQGTLEDLATDPGSRRVIGQMMTESRAVAEVLGIGADHVRYLVRLAELELIDRERRMVERRIRQARFPAVKSLDSFDFKVIPSLNKMLVVELARCEYVERRENIIALGNSGTGKTHIALGLGLAACQKGLSVGFTTAAALVHELMEVRDESGPAHPPCPYPGDERRELSSQPKPKTAKIPKTACLTVNTIVDPVGPQAPPALLRSA